MECKHTKMNGIRNESIREKVEVVPIEVKLRETHLGWYGHVLSQQINV